MALPVRKLPTDPRRIRRGRRHPTIRVRRGYRSRRIKLTGRLLLSETFLYVPSLERFVCLERLTPLEIEAVLTRTTRIGTTFGSGAAAHGTGAATSASFTPNNNSFLVVRISGTQETDGGIEGTSFTLSDSINGSWSTTLRREVSVSSPGWSYGESLWGRGITTGASMTVSGDCGASNIRGYRIEVWDFTDYDTSTPIGTTGVATDADGNGVGTITLGANPASTSQVIATVHVGIGSGAASVTQGSDFTELTDASITGWMCCQSQVRTSSTSTSVTWQDLQAGAGTPVGATMIAIEIRQAASGQTITPSGIASAASLGSHTVANVAAQSVMPSGVASAAAYGSHTLVETIVLTPSGIASAASYGSHTLANVAAQSVTPNGITTAAAYGSHTVETTVTNNIAPSGVASAAAYGSHTVADVTLSITPNGIASAAAYGMQVVANATPQAVTPNGIASAAAYGSHTVADVTLQVLPGGVASAAQYGLHALTGGFVAVGTSRGGMHISRLGIWLDPRS